MSRHTIDTGLLLQEKTWGLLRNSGMEEALQFARHAVPGCRACCEAVALAVCELSENLLKYSFRSDDLKAGSIAIQVEGDRVRVSSRNSAASPDDAAVVLRLVSCITPANIADLYRARLEELFKDPLTARTQLGILRLTFEGGFALSSTYEAPILEIVAERVCAEGA